ncbi:MAG: type II toxin-antitoxin system VapC family toxin [Candidatus Competibacteraceae bacterium]|nr:type II toxin-antitoxin system VapC family toxin [Candidatus Competibacteraceae bacterium]
MRYLLDTHILLWMRHADRRLSRERWEPVFYDSENEILFSLVSIWEIAIKRSLGKLDLDGELEDFARTLATEHGFRQLPVRLDEICRLESLPAHHRDPFDRLLIAQCIENDVVAVTNDPRWSAYPVQVEF